MNGCNEFFLESTSYLDVLEQMQDGIMVVDTDFRIQFWNPAATRILGYEFQDVYGKSCESLGPLCKRDTSGRLLCGGGLCPLKLCIAGGFSGAYPTYIFIRSKEGRDVPLSMSINALKEKTGTIRGAVAVFRDMSEEYGQLRLAGEIQKNMVTTKPFSHKKLRISTLFHSLEVTGGDFVEAFLNDSGTLIASSADATGHGVSAALFAMIYKTLFHSSLKADRSAAQILEYINDGFLRTSTVEGYYLTASVLVMDPESASGVYASAGHPMALVFRKRHDVMVPEPIRERSFMIGMVESVKYPEIKIHLSPGDILFIASDGLYEAEDQQGNPFGIEGVAAFFADGGRDLEELYAILKSRISIGDLEDDISALMIEALE